jgi:hypothetical protein
LLAGGYFRSGERRMSDSSGSSILHEEEQVAALVESGLVFIIAVVRDKSLRTQERPKLIK